MAFARQLAAQPFVSSNHRLVAAMHMTVCHVLSMAQEARKQYIQMHGQNDLSCSDRENHHLWLVIGSLNARHSVHLQS